MGMASVGAVSRGLASECPCLSLKIIVGGDVQSK